MNENGTFRHRIATPALEVLKSPSGPAGNSKWRRMLRKERVSRVFYRGFSEDEWRKLLRNRNVTSNNHDTVLSLDWPHYCVGASVACGGAKGYCYTFNGLLAGSAHINKVTMVDALATQWPELFADVVASEVDKAVEAMRLTYRNLRYSGSGEIALKHMKALEAIERRGIHLWGFTRNLSVARALRGIGASVIVSYDHSTPLAVATEASLDGFPLGYSSLGVDDKPPVPAVVIFPVHRSGRVAEVVAEENLCPKVVYEYFHHERPAATCQTTCFRCHRP